MKSLPFRGNEPVGNVTCECNKDRTVSNRIRALYLSVHIIDGTNAKSSLGFFDN